MIHTTALTGVQIFTVHENRDGSLTVEMHIGLAVRFGSADLRYGLDGE